MILLGKRRASKQKEAHKEAEEARKEAFDKVCKEAEDACDKELKGAQQIMYN